MVVILTPQKLAYTINQGFFFPPEELFFFFLRGCPVAWSAYIEAGSIERVEQGRRDERQHKNLHSNLLERTTSNLTILYLS